MTRPVAKQGDAVIGLDKHIVLVPSPSGPVPTLVSMPFSGTLSDSLARRVICHGKKVAVRTSGAPATMPHLPLGGPFQVPPENRATVSGGSERVLCEGKPIARSQDPAICCNDPASAETGHIVATGRVIAG